jgi:hypothetical protein
MPRHIRLQPYLTERDLHVRYRQAQDPVVRSRWQFLWLLTRGLTATTIARVTGYSAYWIGQIAEVPRIPWKCHGSDALRMVRERNISDRVSAGGSCSLFPCSNTFFIFDHARIDTMHTNRKPMKSSKSSGWLT